MIGKGSKSDDRGYYKPTAKARSLEWVGGQEGNREKSERLPDYTLLLFTAESLVSC